MGFHKILMTWSVLYILCGKKYFLLAIPVPNEESQSLDVAIIGENASIEANTEIPTDVKENLDGRYIN